MKQKVIKERPINEDEYNKIISNHIKTLGNKEQKSTFKTISEQGWFKSYALKSQSQLRKITEKVKKGIRHGQFTYGSNKGGGQQPDKNKEKRKTIPKKTKNEKENDKIIKNATNKTKSKTNKAKLIKGHEKYPDATKYELVHGVNSIASQKYRLRHGKNREYTGKIILKKEK